MKRHCNSLALLYVWDLNALSLRKGKLTTLGWYYWRCLLIRTEKLGVWFGVVHLGISNNVSSKICRLRKNRAWSTKRLSTKRRTKSPSTKRLSTKRPSTKCPSTVFQPLRPFRLTRSFPFDRRMSPGPPDVRLSVQGFRANRINRMLWV